MENNLETNLAPTQTPIQLTPPTSPSTNWLSILFLVFLGLFLISASAFAGFQSGKKHQATSQKVIAISPTPTVTSTPTPTSEPVLTPTITPTSTPTPSPTSSITTTPTPKPFSVEEMLMRKTLAGFEMYVGNGNAAGALTFFTPAISTSAKQKYQSLKAKNLPFTLKSWAFVQDGNYLLVAEEIKNGYRVSMNECRSSGTTCPTLFIELVRDENAENGFSIDRYYGSSYMYQNNLGEEIKYQGFEL